MRPLKFRRYFHHEIRCAYGELAAPAICADIDARYEAIRPDVAFARTSSNPVDRRLEFCAYFLATIQALEARGAVFTEIERVCVAIATSYVRPRNWLHRWLKRLPPHLIGTPVMRLIAHILGRKAGKKGHPDGFLLHVITDPAQTFGLGYGFDILECGICTLFRKHGALSYVPILCEVDHLTSSMAGLELVRGGTIARGASKCDFRFKIQRPSG
jgi:hypothetical protein